MGGWVERWVIVGCLVLGALVLAADVQYLHVVTY